MIFSALTGKGSNKMIDMEKVIKGLEKCKRCECDDCTEKGASQAPWDCPVYDDFVDSAIAMLKEQKAVEPVTESSVYDPDTWFFVCGSCKKGVIEREDKYCRWCGNAVKWND